MSRINHVNATLNDLAGEMGLPGLELDASHRASLTFDDRLVTFAYRHDPMELLWIHVDLGPVHEADPDTPSRILELNLQTWLTDRMTLGLDDAGTRLIGFNVLPVVSLDAAALSRVLDMMLETAGIIQDELKRPGHAPVHDGTTGAETGIDLHRKGFMRV